MQMKSICHQDGTMGAAQVIDSSGNAADAKAHSAWLAEMKNAAESSDRDPIYAHAMADPSIDLPEYRCWSWEIINA